jgi:hypothetical protein
MVRKQLDDQQWARVAAVIEYKARSEIECTFNLLKQARRFATRYKKTLRNYAAVVAIGCALLWLRIGVATLRTLGQAVAALR